MSNTKVRLQCGRVWLEVDVIGVKAAMKALGEYQEVFLERKCGQCGKEDIIYEHRQVDGHDYYSLKCADCGAQLDFGQHKNGVTLFAKRKLPDGTFDKEHRGWYRYQDRSRSDEQREF